MTELNVGSVASARLSLCLDSVGKEERERERKEALKMAHDKRARGDGMKG